MKHFVTGLFYLFIGSPFLGATFTVNEPTSSATVWEYQINESMLGPDYLSAVRELMTAWERQQGINLAPGTKGKAGLKVYTNSGPGLATPKALVRAVIELLVERGWKRDRIFILDLNGSLLRKAGFLPKLSEGGSDFEGSPVYVLQSEQYFDEQWFYDSPLPDLRGRLLSNTHTPSPLEGEDQERRSFLPIPLLFDADIWINLPMVTDHPALGVNGALANATLWNVSNQRRFLKSAANAPVATAEIAAIPELRRGWTFTLMTLERYQYVGGPNFYSLYTNSEPLLWLSSDPVALDNLMYARINSHRKAAGFEPIEPTPIVFYYCERLHIGTSQEILLKQVPIP